MTKLKLLMVVMGLSAAVWGCGAAASSSDETTQALQPTAPRPVPPVPEVKGNYADINGLKMYYEIHGEGKPCVVLHGAFGWATPYPLLAKNRQLILVELQGHGHTSDIDRPLTIEQLADDVAALIKHLKLEEPDLLGYSMGGCVALGVAVRHPGLVRRVAVTGAHAGKIGETYEPASYQQFQSLPADFAPPILKQQYDRVAPNPEQWPKLVAKIKQMGLEFKGFTREQLQSIKVPVLITQGDRDGTRPEHAVEIFRSIPNSQLAIFPDGDHFIIFQSPETLFTPVVKFFDTPAPGTQSGLQPGTRPALQPGKQPGTR